MMKVEKTERAVYFYDGGLGVIANRVKLFCDYCESYGVWVDEILKKMKEGK